MATERSIDFAKTASISQMDLNNKVVNMRQTVKRSKVQVINKLTKTITKLKKKRGTDEQRKQNLQKADRLIEEIDSIKKLKPDKVSKYALANKTTFNDVSKISLSAGPRALARLADHPLMTQVVSNFRSEHADWQDLAAFLLVKQTGRRFKTKKQKQKTLSHTVENINASETMTKAYIQARFGEEGVQTAERKFERKRKLKKKKAQSDGEVANEEGSSTKKVRLEENDTPRDTFNEDKNSSVAKSEIELSPSKCNISTSKSNKNVEKQSDEESSDCEKVHEEKEESDVQNSESDSGEQENSKEGFDANLFSKKTDKTPKTSRKEEKTKSSLSKHTETRLDENTMDKESSEEECSSDDDSKSGSQQSHRTESIESRRMDCVVKEFDLDAGNLEVDSDNDSVQSIEEANSKRKISKTSKMKKRKVPDFLLQGASNSTTDKVKDSFFAGDDDDSDDAQEDNGFEVEQSAKEFVDEEFFDNDNSRKEKTKSMFYNPHSIDYEKRGLRKEGKFDSRRGKDNFRNHGKSWERTHSHSQRGRGSWRGEDRGRGKGNRFKTYGNKTSSNQWENSPIENKQPSSVGAESIVKSTEKLHPSWEASKKRKAQQSGVVPFKGQKITFNDDD